MIFQQPPPPEGTELTGNSVNNVNDDKTVNNVGDGYMIETALRRIAIAKLYPVYYDGLSYLAEPHHCKAVEDMFQIRKDAKMREKAKRCAAVKEEVEKMTKAIAAAEKAFVMLKKDIIDIYK